jgi:hypothetical protein
MNNKYCECCDVHITRQNFTTHKKTRKHLKNKDKYKPINLLEIKEDKNNISCIKFQLEDIKTNIENIINNLN